jgi:hypothetical protein
MIETIALTLVPQARAIAVRFGYICRRRIAQTWRVRSLREAKVPVAVPQREFRE